jgi:GNAT superfamily N-acetyltransferase
VIDRFTSRPFDPAHHDTSEFDCGEPSLNDWLRKHAASSAQDAADKGRPTALIWAERSSGQIKRNRLHGWEGASAGSRRGTALTWVWIDNRDRVIAYYAMAAHKVSREDVPTNLRRGGPVEVPAVLLAKLALTGHEQGRGLGSVLAFDALERVITATAQVAARFVVVEAINERAASFYEGLGFRRVPGALLLVQRTASISAAISRSLDGGE